jgi:predicted esterase
MLHELLQDHGFAVTWHPFDGGHEIPQGVVDDLKAFVFQGGADESAGSERP